MSEQAENFKNLVKGNPISSIKQALNILKPNVRKELMDEYGVTDVDALAIKLS